jgi:transcriptional regulator with XRE-family HTH domain/quercetin dioxygenase-like cupin family protein
MHREAADALEGVGAKMRALRLERKVSLRGLARQIHVTPSLISQIETGKIRPSVASLYAIASALDVPLDYFFGESPRRTGQTPRSSLPSMAEMVAQREKEAETVTPGNGADSGESPRPSTQVVRRQERERIGIDGFGGVVIWERLTDRDPQIDFLEIHYDPGASSARNYLRHSGKEYGVVLEGELTVSLAFEDYRLRAGDSIAFESSTPHRLANLGSTPVCAIWVVTNRQFQPSSSS